MKAVEESGQQDPAGASTRASDAKSPGSGKPPASGGSGDVGNALRAVYQDAIGESIPDEMLDLLSKLQ